MKDHKHYELCYRAHQGTSHSPDRRAEMMCRNYDVDIATLKEKGCTEEQIAKFDKLFVNWCNAKSRCISVLVAGAGNFPVRRNQKANEAERRRYDEMTAYFDKITRPLKVSTIIKSSDEDAIDKLKMEIEKLEKQQELSKSVNKINRSKKSDDDKLMSLIAIGFAQANAKEALNKIIKPYQLTNNNAKIKRYKERLAMIQNVKARDSKEIEKKHYTVVENTDMMRYQIIFNEKPSTENIAKLKNRGFKWAPSQNAWQRQITANGKWALDNIIKELEM